VNYLFDSSVLVAGLLRWHPHNERARPWVEGMTTGEITVALNAHSLAETYSGLTMFPASPKVQPSMAFELIRDNTAKARIVPLTEADYRQTIQRVADMGLPGGLIYDALIAHTAQGLNVNGLVTFNVRHFQRVWPEGHDRIILP